MQENRDLLYIMLSSVRPELNQIINNILNQISPSSIYKQTKTEQPNPTEPNPFQTEHQATENRDRTKANQT